MKRPMRFANYETSLIAISDQEEPHSFEWTMKGGESEKWKKGH